MIRGSFRAAAVVPLTAPKASIAGAVQNAIAQAMENAGAWREQKIIIQTRRQGDVIVYAGEARRTA